MNRSHKATLGMAGALVLACLLVFGPVGGFEFVNYDDPAYLLETRHVANGLSWDGVKWAFARADAYGGLPVTTISYMIDSSLFGLRPRPFHFSNLFLHGVNTLLIFALLRRLLKSDWPAFFGAAFFALHPLHVESVAWVSARKDLLATLFSSLCLLAYLRYAQAPSPRSKGYYALAILFSIGALLAKTSAVILPAILLLLDFWPLRRLAWSQAGGREKSLALIGEKIPFFVPGLLATVWVFRLQQQGGALSLVSDVTIGDRLIGAMISYATYVVRTFWPFNLAVYYPYPSTWQWPAVALSAVLVTGLTMLAIVFARRWPFFATGWGWFGVGLLPVIGLIQTGRHLTADRYTYFPLTGLLLLIVWGAMELAGSSRIRQRVFSGVGALALVACALISVAQLRHWQNGETLMRRAIAVSGGDAVTYGNLGADLEKRGRLDEAEACYREALRLRPGDAVAQSNLGQVLTLRGRLDEAHLHLEAALRTDPRSASALYNLGNLLDRQGKTEAAIEAYRRALETNGNLPDAHNNLGCLLAQQGKMAEAVPHFEAALRLRPDFLDALNNLGGMLIETGRAREAVPQLKRALQLKPDYADARFNLGNAYLALQQPRAAFAEYQGVVDANPAHARAHYRLGNLYLAEQNFAAAAGCYQNALQHEPNLPEARYQLATILVARNQPAAAAGHLRAAIQSKPDWVEALNNLAWIYATSPDAKVRDGPQAVALALRAVSLTQTNAPDPLDTLAAAHAEAGDFSAAIRDAELALKLAGRPGLEKMAAGIQARLESYRAHQPFRE